MTMELHASADEVMRAVEAFQEFARARKIPESTVFGLALALEECASNIVIHALRRDPHQKFQVSLAHNASAICIELRDPGPEFDPTTAPQKQPVAEDDDLPGGWGIQLIRQYVDEIHYQRKGHENVVRLTRRTDSANNSPSSSTA